MTEWLVQPQCLPGHVTGSNQYRWVSRMAGYLEAGAGQCGQPAHSHARAAPPSRPYARAVRGGPG